MTTIPQALLDTLAAAVEAKAAADAATLAAAASAAEAAADAASAAVAASTLSTRHDQFLAVADAYLRLGAAAPE